MKRPRIWTLLAILVLCTASVRAATCSGSSHTVTDAGTTDFGPVAVTVELMEGDTETLTLRLAQSLSPGAADLDVYFLIDTSKEATDAVTALGSTGATPLGAVMDAILAVNTGTRFGAGTFQNKPLGGLGWNSWRVYANAQAMTADTALVQQAVDAMAASVSGQSEQRKMRSSLEAMYQVALRADTLGFRAGARKVLVVVTDRPYNVQGDVLTYMVSPNPIDSISIGSTTYPATPTYPANDGDVNLESGCALTGQLCLCGIGEGTSPPECASCGPLSYERRYQGTSSNMPPGACEDFPSLATATTALAGFEIWAVFPDAASATGASAQAPWQALATALGGGSGVYEEPDMAAVLAPLAAVATVQPTVTHAAPAVESVTMGTLEDGGTDYYTAAIALELGVGESASGAYVFTVAGRETTVTYTTCTPPTPGAETPAAETAAPESAPPATDVPATDAPATDAPATDVPQTASDAPAQSAPPTASSPESPSQSDAETASAVPSDSPVPANRAPVFIQPAPIQVTEGDTVMIHVGDFVTDPESDGLTFSLYDMSQLPGYHTPALNGVAELMDAGTGDVTFTAIIGAEARRIAEKRRRATMDGMFAVIIYDGNNTLPPSMVPMTIQLLAFDPEDCADCELDIQNNCVETFVKGACDCAVPCPIFTIPLEDTNVSLPIFIPVDATTTQYLSIDGTAFAPCLGGLGMLEVLVGGNAMDFAPGDQLVIELTLELAPNTVVGPGCAVAKPMEVLFVPDSVFATAGLFFVHFDHNEVAAAKACGVGNDGWITLRLSSASNMTLPNFFLVDIDTGMCTADQGVVDIDILEFILSGGSGSKTGKNAKFTLIITLSVWGGIMLIAMAVLTFTRFRGSGDVAVDGGSVSEPLLGEHDKDM